MFEIRKAGQILDYIRTFRNGEGDNVASFVVKSTPNTGFNVAILSLLRIVFGQSFYSSNSKLGQ